MAKPNHKSTRRSFLLAAAAAGTSLGRGFAQPTPAISPKAAPPPVRVRGRVTRAGTPVERAAVSDGVSVAVTGPNGEFELISSRRGFVHLSLPSGCRIPTQSAGTAMLHRPIRPDRRGEMAVEFDLSPLRDSDRDHGFFLLADPQTEDAYEVGLFQSRTATDVRAVLESADWRETAFGIGCGDLMFDHLELFPEYERAVSAMGTPFFQVVGNHDLDQTAATDEASTATFQGHFGPEYYSFNRGAVHYVVLNDVFWYGGGYLGYLTERQLVWLEADLALVERGGPVVVALHIPLLSTRFRRDGEASPHIASSVQNRDRLYRLLEPFQAHVLSGHTHESEHVFEGGLHEHVHGTACGAWWSGPICWDGCPNGYAVYEVRGEELRWRYKSTGRDFSHQMRVYPRGADPAAPDEIVANVWDWDPKWKVFWYENGGRRGEMARRTGRDPLAVRLHTGPDLPPRRPWVEPVATDHMFYAPATPGARVTVEAIDRFGRAYTATLDDPTE